MKWEQISIKWLALIFVIIILVIAIVTYMGSNRTVRVEGYISNLEGTNSSTEYVLFQEMCTCEDFLADCAIICKAYPIIGPPIEVPINSDGSFSVVISRGVRYSVSMPHCNYTKCSTTFPFVFLSPPYSLDNNGKNCIMNITIGEKQLSTAQYFVN